MIAVAVPRLTISSLVLLSKVKIQPAHQVGKYGGMFVLVISRFIQLITSVL